MAICQLLPQLIYISDPLQDKTITKQQEKLKVETEKARELQQKAIELITAFGLEQWETYIIDLKSLSEII